MFKLFVIALRITSRIERLNWDLMPEKRARRVYQRCLRALDKAAQDARDRVRKVPMSSPKYYVLMATYDHVVGEGYVSLRHVEYYLNRH